MPNEDVSIDIHTLAPLFGPIGGGGGGFLGASVAAPFAAGAGGGADASSARTTSFLLGLLKVKKLTREDWLVLAAAAAAVGRLEVSTKLEAAEAKLVVAMEWREKPSPTTSFLSISLAVFPQALDEPYVIRGVC